jgi:hypothetical protein
VENSKEILLRLNVIFLLSLSACGNGEAISASPLRLKKPVPPPSHRLEARTLSAPDSEPGSCLESELFPVTGQYGEAKTARFQFAFHFHNGPRADGVSLTLNVENAGLHEPIPLEFEVTRLNSNVLQIGNIGIFSAIWLDNRPLFSFKLTQAIHFGNDVADHLSDYPVQFQSPE